MSWWIWAITGVVVIALILVIKAVRESRKEAKRQRISDTEAVTEAEWQRIASEYKRTQNQGASSPISGN